VSCWTAVSIRAKQSQPEGVDVTGKRVAVIGTGSSGVTSLSYPANDKGALEVSDEERERELEARYEAGGLNMVGVFTDVMSTRRRTSTSPSSSAGRSAPASLTRRSPRPSCLARTRGARSARASTRSTTRRSTATT
jgi:hypothetical protein